MTDLADLPSVLRDQRITPRLPLPPVDSGPVVKLEHARRDSYVGPWRVFGIIALGMLAAVVLLMLLVVARGAK